MENICLRGKLFGVGANVMMSFRLDLKMCC